MSLAIPDAIRENSLLAVPWEWSRRCFVSAVRGWITDLLRIESTQVRNSSVLSCIAMEECLGEEERNVLNGGYLVVYWEESVSLSMPSTSAPAERRPKRKGSMEVVTESGLRH